MEILIDSQFRDATAHPLASSFSFVCCHGASVRHTRECKVALMFINVKMQDDQPSPPYFLVSLSGYNMRQVGSQHVIGNVAASKKATFVVPPIGVFRAEAPVAQLSLDITNYMNLEVCGPDGIPVNAERVVIVARISNMHPPEVCSCGPT